MIVASACGGASKPAPRAGDDTEEPPPRFAAALRMREEAPDPEQDVPRTRIELVLHAREGPSRTTDVGVFEGVCAQKHGGGRVLLRVQCWWAGPRAEIVVLRRGDTLVVERGPPTGELQVVARVELPRDAVVEPILPAALRDL